jgi:outer membrane protein assembly factor BamB
MRCAPWIAAVVLATASVLAAPAAAPAAGGWPQYGWNARHTFSNPAEAGITPRTVAALRPGWARIIAPSADLTATPTVAAGRVIVAARGGPLVAFDATSGTRLWAVAGDVAGQPAVAGGRVLACVDGVLHAYGLGDGLPRFTAGACRGGPAVDGARGFSAEGRIVAWSTVDGRRLWRSPLGITFLDQTPTVGYGRVFAGGARPDDRNVYVLDEATGRVLKVHRAGAGCLSGTPPFLCGYRVMSGSSLVGGNLWFVRFLWCGACADVDGSASVRAFPVTAWARPPAAEALVHGEDEIAQYWDPATPPPVAGDGHVFLPTLDADEIARRLVPAASEWRTDAVPPTMNATLVPGVAFFDTCGCAVSTASGRVLWSSGRPWAQVAPAVAGGVVYWPQDGALRTYRLPG